MVDTRIAGFYRWPLERRRAHLASMLGLAPSELGALDAAALSLELADKLVENVIGVLGIPVGLGLNLRVNGEDVLVPMAIEEPSVIAAFSHAAKIARHSGGFFAEADESVMIGQIQLCPKDEAEAERAAQALTEGTEVLSREAARASRSMAARGGGFRGLEVRTLRDPSGAPPMVILHLFIDVVDAMGANAVNHVVEVVAPTAARLSGVEVNLRILSNLAARRLARAKVRIDLDPLGGMEVARRIVDADRMARLDPFRAATHNKGLLNGIDAVALATGNDWRSIEAGAHAWAARDGQYRGLTRWVVEDGVLFGSLELPLAVGTVGGTTGSHPSIAFLRTLIGAESARELACVLASVGLAQNLAALRALATEGIQRGHMELHARQLALAAGAEAREVDVVVRAMLEAGTISGDAARSALEGARFGEDGVGKQKKPGEV